MSFSIDGQETQSANALQQGGEGNTSVPVSILRPYNEPSEPTRQELGLLTKHQFWFLAGTSAATVFFRMLKIWLLPDEGSPPADLLGAWVFYTSLALLVSVFIGWFEQAAARPTWPARRYIINLFIITMVLSVSVYHLIRPCGSNTDSLLWRVLELCLVCDVQLGIALTTSFLLGDSRIDHARLYLKNRPPWFLRRFIPGLDAETTLSVLSLLTQANLTGRRRIAQWLLRRLEIASFFIALMLDAYSIMLLFAVVSRYCSWAGYMEYSQKTDEPALSFIKGLVVCLTFPMMHLLPWKVYRKQCVAIGEEVREMRREVVEG
ncbi:hypothetical protein EG328_007820 [Venturia inaequalis]|uniref:Uncharacterized protein n=1 Tax=Venturia inaequalis TaxID=5025 RepID=A0A8H3UCJ6_VENIN|nr:hypothetical protein EG328_007820 [Venturia inaequalis]KAE9980892.1 hypothetical protein EG327_006419 [Venturia inaequalis]RDI84855.1 hypothetical protein Vi05172_g4870 [Venturia inaequalis]